jgi:putative DNA primase/helicase
VVVIEKVLDLAKSKQWGICQNGGFVYLYNGAYWQVLEEKVLKLALKRAAYLMGIPEYVAKQSNVGDRLLKEFYDTGFQQMPKTDKVLINLQNGTLEISEDGTYKLREFRPDDFLRYQLPFAYDPTAECPKWQALLDEVLPDKSSQMVLAEAFGSVFIKNGYLKLEKTLVLLGFGANGKSVAFDVFGALVGRENMTSYGIGSLCDASGYARAMLQNSLVNYGSEFGGGRQFDSHMFKQLCSGEPVDARLPYKEPFNIYDYARLFFNANSLPKEVEHTDGYFRRFLIIPFVVTIPPERQDLDLAKKIISADLPGILNWVLGGLKRIVRQRKFSECEASKKALEQYRMESDSVLLFVSDKGYVRSVNNHLLLKELYDDYTSYCKEGGLRYVSLREFSKRLQAIPFEVKKDVHGANGARIVYTEIRPESDSEESPL